MATVRINPRLEAEVTGHLAEHGPLSRVLGEEAERIARRARQIARGEFYATGAYTRSIQADSGLDEHGQLVGRVYATDWKAHWAEFGTSRMRAHHILARAAQQVGFRVLAGQTLGLAGEHPEADLLRRPREDVMRTHPAGAELRPVRLPVGRVDPADKLAMLVQTRVGLDRPGIGAGGVELATGDLSGAAGDPFGLFPEHPRQRAMLREMAGDFGFEARVDPDGGHQAGTVAFSVGALVMATVTISLAAASMSRSLGIDPTVIGYMSNFRPATSPSSNHMMNPVVPL